MSSWSLAFSFGESRGETGAWQYWSPERIAQVTGCPASNIREDWPLIHAALLRQKADSRNNQAAAIATVAIETASTFKPVREAFWMSENWRRANLRYYPGYGRGYIQLTWIDPNYINAGNYIGVDLKNNPDRAMEPAIAAAVFAWYWTVARPGIPGWAEARNLREVRKAVQGGDAGLDRLIQICHHLLDT